MLCFYHGAAGVAEHLWLATVLGRRLSVENLHEWDETVSRVSFKSVSLILHTLFLSLCLVTHPVFLIPVVFMSSAL